MDTLTHLRAALPQLDWREQASTCYTGVAEAFGFLLEIHPGSGYGLYLYRHKGTRALVVSVSDTLPGALARYAENVQLVAEAFGGSVPEALLPVHVEAATPSPRDGCPVELLDDHQRPRTAGALESTARDSRVSAMRDAIASMVKIYTGPPLGSITARLLEVPGVILASAAPHGSACVDIRVCAPGGAAFEDITNAIAETLPAGMDTCGVECSVSGIRWTFIDREGREIC